MTKLINFIPITKALVQLIPGSVEVVLHDLNTGKIAHIENSFSPRRAGDDSLVETTNYARELVKGDIIPPYQKSNSDGSKLKSVSALIKDDDETHIGLLCINLRVEALEMAAELLISIASVDVNNRSGEILKNDWRELVNTTIAKVLQDRKIAFSQAKRADRVEIIGTLTSADVFEARGSVDYVADALGISRANIYDLLKQVRSPAPSVRQSNRKVVK